MDIKQNDSHAEFDRTKIYEKLEYSPEPEGYDKKVAWIVQNQIADTNGRHYSDRVGKLNQYPDYELPIHQSSGDKIMLDIGSGWGRWLVSGSKKGYIPVGVDIRLEFSETQQTVLKDFQIPGYSVVGDLTNLPFVDNSFDFIWSFSVLQHTHKIRLINCLQGISRLLTNNGFMKLELPNKNGFRNRMRPDIINDPEQDDFDSWSVRYYTLDEYRAMMEPILKDITISNHSFLGIGVLKEDLKYVSFKNKILCLGSLTLSGISELLPFMKNYSDSLYFQANKKITSIPNTNINNFVQVHRHQPFDNLHIVSLLKCPKYGSPLSISKDRTKVLSENAGIYYPVINQIPVMIVSEAHPM